MSGYNRVKITASVNGWPRRSWWQRKAKRIVVVTAAMVIGLDTDR